MLTHPLRGEDASAARDAGGEGPRRENDPPAPAPAGPYSTATSLARQSFSPAVRALITSRTATEREYIPRWP